MYKILMITLVCFAANVVGEESHPVVTKTPPKKDKTDKQKNRNIVVTKNGSPVRTKNGGYVVYGIR